MKKKRCGKCGLTKALSEFSPHPSCRDGVRGTCKPCASELAKQWQRKKKASLRGYLHVLLSATRNRARSSRVPFDLTLDYLVELWEGQAGKCAVSGLSFQRSRSKWVRNPYNPSLDRIIPMDGYVRGNVRFVLDAVNVALNEWGLQEVLPIFAAIVQRHRS